MSIKGIDNQMMITRTAELAKDATSQLKRGELAQDYLAVQAKALAEHEQGVVQKAQKPHEALIQKDKQGSQQQGQGRQGGGAQADEGEDEGENLLAADRLAMPKGEMRTIDIKV